MFEHIVLNDANVLCWLTLDRSSDNWTEWKMVFDCYVNKVL